MDIAERRLPQDGRINVRSSGAEIDVRVSTIPTAYGESVSLRLLTRSSIFLGLESLGLNKEDEKIVRKLVELPHGIILVTGPTGSGKSTSLYAFLSTINSIDQRIITIEEPVEYELPGVNQISVKSEIGLTFASGLRHILRQDPDVIMVGEVRDLETAEIAIRAALTGHLVFSTLHTNDAPGAITRLIDMGIEPFLVSSSVEALIAQRLIRTLCKIWKMWAGHVRERCRRSCMTCVAGRWCCGRCGRGWKPEREGRVVDSPERALQPVLPKGVGAGGAGAVERHRRGRACWDVPAQAPSSTRTPPVVVLSGDVPLVSAEAIRQLTDAHEQSGAAATMATTILDDPSGYGRVVRDGSGAVERVVETKEHGDSTPEERQIREVNTGVYVFDARALMQALPRLSAENAQGELYLPQVLDLINAHGAAVAAHVVEDRRLVLGVNDRVALAGVRKLAQEAIHERHMRAGVAIVDPGATVIDADVVIGQDTVIEPFTTIRGSRRSARTAPSGTHTLWIACSRTG